MAQNEGGSHDSSRAEELFAQFMAQCEGGEENQFEEFCKEHAAHAVSLREHFADWERVKAILERLRVAGSLASRLKQEYGSDAGSTVSLKGEEEGPEDTEALSEASREARRGPRPSRREDRRRQIRLPRNLRQSPSG